MRDYAKISPKIWINEIGRKLKKLGIETQLISLYLQTNPHANMIGAYYLPVSLVAHETGLSQDAAFRAIKCLCEINFCRYDSNTEYVWVCEMASDQIADQLKPNDNRIKAVSSAFNELPELPFIGEIYERYEKSFLLASNNQMVSPFEDPSKPLQSQEKEQEKEQEKKKNKSGKPDMDTQAIEILEFLNHKTGKAYRPVEANLELISARLNSGATVMDCRQVIAKKTREWSGNAKMQEYLRPATLFNATKFEQYMGELVLPKMEVIPRDGT